LWKILRLDTMWANNKLFAQPFFITVISGREKKSLFQFTRFDDIETRKNHVSATKNELEAILPIFD